MNEEIKAVRKYSDLPVTTNMMYNYTGLDYSRFADSLDFIYSQVKNLRKKMKAAGAQAEIKAVYGFGYKLAFEP